MRHFLSSSVAHLEGGGMVKRVATQPYSRPSIQFWRRTMFLHRYYDYDDRKYKRGYYFNFLGIFRILKFNTATVMQKPDHIFIVGICGREFVIK
jgi:hypothetical protein